MQRSIQEEIALIAIDEMLKKYRKQPDPFYILDVIEQLKTIDLSRMSKPDTSVFIGYVLFVVRALAEHHGLGPETVSAPELCYITAQLIRIPDVIRVYHSLPEVAATEEQMSDLLKRIKGIA